MFKIIIPILVVVLAAFIGMNAQKGLIRGMADNMLVSPAHPAVAVSPAPSFHSVDARRVEISPSVQNSLLPATSVQVVYVLYDRAEPKARLASLLAVSEKGETWPVEPEAGFPVLRHMKRDINGFSGFIDTYVLGHAGEPWHRDDTGDWEHGSLVCRFTTLLWFYQAKLMVEYREPLPVSEGMPLADNVPLLAAFEGRAMESFRLVNGEADKGGVKLPKPKEKLPYPPAELNRKALTSFVGTLWELKSGS